MSIIKKEKTDLANENLYPLNIVIKKIKDMNQESDYYKDEVIKLKDVNQNNIELALKLKEIRQKYDEMKNQHNQDIKILINQKKIIDKINFTLYCPELKKEIEFYQCCESCYSKLCKPLYGCNNRLEEIKNYFKI